MNPGCFCYLVNHSGSNSVDTCVHSLILLNKNYLSRFPTPIIMFHEDGLTDKMKSNLSQVCKIPPIFVRIEFKVPCYVKEINKNVRLGYMHMCKFFANDIFHQDILNDFKYYCRLDTDSFILSPVTINIFEEAKQNEIYYGFINDSITDTPCFIQNLWNESQIFINNHKNFPVFSKLYTEIEEGRLYYTNFELCYIHWFKNDPWKSYFEAINNYGGIYKYRWGDHVIRYIGVRSFLSPIHIRKITNIHYAHQGYEDNKPK